MEQSESTPTREQLKRLHDAVMEEDSPTPVHDYFEKMDMIIAEPGVSLPDRARVILVNHINDNRGHSGRPIMRLEEAYVVWFTKTLQNWKALLSTTQVDGMYYELTYDGNKNAVYVDAYIKAYNHEILL